MFNTVMFWQLPLTIISIRTKTILIITIILLTTSITFAQQQKKEDIYLLPDQIEKAASYLQSTHWSRIGGDQKSLEVHCKGYDELVMNPMDLEQIQNSEVVDAMKLIKERAKNHQIIFINEEHHSNRQRKFVADLLPSLKAMGFTHFCAETFDHRYIQTLNTTKTPTLNTGYYSVNPVFGELIRVAAANDFTFHAYESQEHYYPKSTKFAPPKEPVFEGDSMTYQMNQFNYEMNLRSYHQFVYIAQLIEKEPNAKIIIYCGYDHLNEANLYDWIPLAARIKQSLNIDPLTIDLTLFSEKCAKDVHPAYLAIKELGVKKPSVLMTKDKTIFKPQQFQKERDIFVFLPPTIEKTNRPSWLFDKTYQSVELKLPQGFSGLVFAYYSKHSTSDDIPADVVSITNTTENPSLRLKKGKYQIELLSKEGSFKRKRLKVK